PRRPGGRLASAWDERFTTFAVPPIFVADAGERRSSIPCLTLNDHATSLTLRSRGSYRAYGDNGPLSSLSTKARLGLLEGVPRWTEAAPERVGRSCSPAFTTRRLSAEATNHLLLSIIAL